MDGSKGSTKRITVRANRAQTVILKGAFTKSSIISPEELKILSEKTGLPEKWIHLWFGRQRVKARKTAVDPGAVTSSVDLVLSPHDILEVKMEYRDSLVPGSPSPVLPVASVIAPTSDGSVSQSDKALSMKKARASQPRAQRVKKKKTTVRQRVIKAECSDPVVNALDNSASVTPSMAQGSISCDSSHLLRPDESSLVTQPAFPFCRIAPPTRTLISANMLAHPHPEDWRSSLSTNQSHRIYSPFGTSDVTTVNVSDSQPSPGTFKSKAAAYQQGPRFHTQFYNNGPANYRNTRSNLGTDPASRSNHIPISDSGSYLAGPLLPMFDLAEQHKIPNQVGLGGYFSQFLAPAFVLENTSKPMPSVVASMYNYSAHTSSSAMQCVGPSTGGQSYPLHYSGGAIHEENDVNADPEAIDIFAQYNLLLSGMETPQTFPTIYNETLDPSLAPLKHLTDILERFRDQDGTYTKLVDLQEREGLMNCLLDDELARRSPFQAAMGLVLLSKLGLEWDY